MAIVWTITAWTLTGAGGVLLLWALFWDRARGRARCRRCWYDLTGAVGGSGKERPAGSRPHQEVVCPECGKGHRSRRSMRRTRRRWWGVMLAGVLLMGAHGARVVPEVQKRGWGAAVPGVVLVAWMPLMSEEPGTGLEGMTFGIAGSGSGLPPVSGMDRLVMNEVGGESYWGSVFGNAHRPSRLGWVSRRMLFLLGRTEDSRVITDSTTAKGHAYKHAVSAVLNSGRAWSSEVR